MLGVELADQGAQPHGERMPLLAAEPREQVAVVLPQLGADPLGDVPALGGQLEAVQATVVGLPLAAQPPAPSIPAASRLTVLFSSPSRSASSCCDSAPAAASSPSANVSDIESRTPACSCVVWTASSKPLGPRELLEEPAQVVVGKGCGVQLLRLLSS